MRLSVLVVAVVLILSVSSVPKVVLAQQAPWINPTLTYSYVSNMIGSYNALAVSDTLKPNFGIVEPHLTLYHSLSTSFEVIVMRVFPNNDSEVSFIFIAIPSPDLQLVFDSTDDLSSVYPIAVDGVGGIAEYNRVTYNDTITNFALIWGVPASDVLINGQVNSKNAAQTVYAVDEKQASAAVASQTTGGQGTTINQTTNQTTNQVATQINVNPTGSTSPTPFYLSPLWLTFEASVTLYFGVEIVLKLLKRVSLIRRLANHLWESLRKIIQ